VLLCSCGRPMSGRPHNGTYPDGQKRRQYFCAKNRRGCGKVAVDMRAADGELQEFVVQRLSDPRFADAIATARNDVTDRLEHVRKEIADCEKLQRALSDWLGRRELTLDSFDAANKPLAEDLARLNDERERLDQGAGDGPVKVQSAEEIRRQWTDAEVPDRRAMLKSALRGGLQAVVKPAGKNGKRKFDRTRITIGKPEKSDSVA
jgi:site-specific DNA recombinase